VLALLASELHWAGERSRCRQLAAEAIEIARAAGDAAALAHALAHGTWATWTPDTLAQRQRLTDELVDLAQRLDDPWLSFLAGFRQGAVGIEAGDRASAESGLATMRTLAASVPQPHIRWVWLVFESCWALVQGELETSEQFAIQSFETATAAGEPDGVILFGALLSGIRDLQGRGEELAEQMVHLAGEPDSIGAYRAGAAQALIQAGREAEARELALAEDFRSIPWDQARACALIAWADVCSRLDLADRSAELYELLAPFAGELAAPPGSVYGTFDWALGALATALERYEQAEDHFAAAAEINEKLGAPIYLARARAGWARALIAGGQPEHLDRARRMLDQAGEAAGRLAAGGISRDVTQGRAALTGTSP
jgi:hypothetical protein